MNLHRAPCFVGSVAQVFQGTLRALGLAGDTNGATVMNDLVGEVDPLLARNDLHQVLFDLGWGLVRRKFQTAGDALHVRVDYDAGGDPES